MENPTENLMALQKRVNFDNPHAYKTNLYYRNRNLNKY